MSLLAPSKHLEWKVVLVVFGEMTTIGLDETIMQVKHCCWQVVYLKIIPTMIPIRRVSNQTHIACRWCCVVNEEEDQRHRWRRGDTNIIATWKSRLKWRSVAHHVVITHCFIELIQHEEIEIAWRSFHSAYNQQKSSFKVRNKVFNLPERNECIALFATNDVYAAFGDAKIEKIATYIRCVRRPGKILKSNNECRHFYTKRNLNSVRKCSKKLLVEGRCHF